MTSIKRFAELLSDSNQLEKLGSEIVREAIKEAAAEKSGYKPSRSDVVRRIRAGELIPSDLNEPGLIAGKTADTGWEKTWTNLGLWDRNWSNNETGIRTNPGDFLSVRNQLRIKEKLSPDEIKVLNDLRITLE